MSKKDTPEEEVDEQAAEAAEAPGEGAEESKPKKKPKGKAKSKAKAKKSEDADKLKEAEERLLRMRAEFDNFRKRSQRDMTEARQITKIATIEEVLPVMDHFQMAMAAANSSDDLETLKQGMNMILTEFERCFENLGVTAQQTDGQAFDPTIHEAVSTEASGDVPEGEIIRTWKTGYMFGERLLRPASVVVSSGEEDGAAETS